MKKLLFGSLLILIVSFSEAQNNPQEKQAVQMLRQFYISYMTAISSDDPKSFSANMKKCELLKAEYCTKKLLNNIPKLAEQSDSDPIINAQDSRMDCVRNLTFKKNAKKPNAYTVSYFYIDDFTKKKETFIINLTVINQNGKYKIDSIF